MGESGLHLLDAISTDSLVGADVDRGGALSIVGASVLSGLGSRDVGVGGLKLGLVCLIVRHGTLRVSTLAAVRAVVCTVGAINELLLREGLEVSSSNIVSTFEGASGGESPA